MKKMMAAALMSLIACSLFAQQKSTDSSITVVVSAAKKGVPLTGIITDAVNGKGVPGIRVQVDDFSAVITDDKGNFTLNVPSYTATVAVEGEGFSARRIPLKGRNTITVSLLDDDHESFHDPVTMPFGSVTKKNITAATGQYNVDAAWTLPGELADGILQGRIAGLNVIRHSGTPGAGANMFLRGYNSLYGTNKPLIIIDGVLFDANEYGESIIANNYNNPMALIDTRDIDNITVLKDASSIYGTRGANGVILITTARAKSQATKIDFAAYTGFNQAPKNLPVMDGAGYRIYLSEILQGQGKSATDIAALPYMNDDPSSAGYARYHNATNWQEKVLGNSLNQNYYLRVTGGDNIATYGLSMGYLKSKGIVKGTDMSRYNTRFNAAFNFAKKFTGIANLSFTYNEQNLKDQGIADKTSPVYLSLIKAPFLTDHAVNDKGVVSPNLADQDMLGFSNPTAIVNEMLAYNKYYRFSGSFGFKYEINKYLSAGTLVGVTLDKIRENFFVPRYGVADDTLPNAIAQSRLGTQVKRLFSIYNDTKLEYVRTFNRVHSLGVRAGMRYQNNKSEQDFALGFNSATDDLVNVQNGVGALRQVGGGIGDWNWLNVYLGADYAWKEKFFLQFNAAMDGSSRFGKQAPGGGQLGGRKFPVMPSLGAAWLISAENFMANSGINLLKLRATYSITGNDDIGNYTSRLSYGAQNLLGVQGLVRTGVANPALQWETSRKLNAGIDFSFWNERVFLGVDAYQNTTSNMLVYRPLATVSGFTSMLTNEGKMKNTGVDVSLNVRIINSRNFKWDAGINAAFTKNRILSVPNDSFTTRYAGATIITQTGAAANQFYGYTAQGVFATDAEATAAGLTKQNTDGSFSTFKGGDIHFADRDGNKIINENDRSVIGDPNPALFGGFNNRLAWKGFELNVLFTYSVGNDVYNYVRYRLEAASGTENQLQSVNNRWRGNGQVTSIPKATWGDPVGNSRFSNRWIEDGAYVRLRSLSLQYNFPVKAKGFLKSAAVYGTGNNLLTFTKYLGYDPEFSASPSVFAQGIDTGLDPQYRSVTMGVKIGF